MTARLLRALDRHAMPVLGISIFVGLAAPPLAAALRPFLEITVVALLTGMLTRLDWAAMIGYSRRGVLVAAAVAWQSVLAPLLIWGLVTVLALPAGLAAAMVLNAAAPALMSAPAFALLLRLDAPLTIVVVVATTLLLPITLVPVAVWMLGLDFAFGPGPFLLRLGLFIVLPFVLALAIRRLAGPARLAAADREIGGVTVLMIAAFAIAIMDGVTARVFAEPGKVAVFVAAAFAVNLVLQAVGGVLFARLGRVPAMSMALVAGNRNMGVMLVVTAGFVGPDFALYVAAAQLPVYLVPPLAAPLYRRLAHGAR